MSDLTTFGWGTTGQTVGDEYRRRRKFTQEKLGELHSTVRLHMADPDEWRDACVYITGSMARDEAFSLSDLDLFIMDDFADDVPRMKPIRHAELLAGLNRVRHEAGFRPFSRGGAFLESHSFHEMMQQAGTPDDDARNHFTARMLLILNSRSLINPDAYQKARSAALNRLYWRDCPDPDEPYLPVFLINDIRRLWQTMCLNFEFNNPPQVVDEFRSASPVERRVGNIKLRAARLLACYTPIIGLLHCSEEQGVTRRQAAEVFGRTPIARLEHVAASATNKKATRLTEEILDLYEKYLVFTNCTKEEFKRKVSNDKLWSRIKHQALGIGDHVSALMEVLGKGKTLYRYVIV